MEHPPEVHAIVEAIKKSDPKMDAYDLAYLVRSQLSRSGFAITPKGTS